MDTRNLAVAASIALLAACQSAGQPEPRDQGPTAMAGISLAGTEWQLKELVSMDDAIGTVRPADPSAYTMALGTNGKVQFRLDCNRANGPWSTTVSSEARSGAITFGPAAMTRAMCPPGSLDSRIARELQFVRSFAIDGNRLTFSLQADGGLQVWEKSPVNAAE